MASDPILRDPIPSCETSPGSNAWWFSFARRYPIVLTLAVLALATGLRMALTPLWGSGYTFITYYPAIMFIALTCGWRYGIATTLSSAVLSTDLFLDIGSLPREQGAALMVFIAANIVIVLLSETVTRGRLQAQAEASIARAEEHHLRREMQARVEADASLRESEARFRETVEATPNGVLLVDERGQMVLVNHAIESMFGYDRTDLLGRPVELLLPERHRNAHPGHRVSFATVPIARPMGVGRDLAGRRKNGTEFPVEIGLAPIAMAQGRMVLCSVVDITERKRAEEALRDSEERLRLFIEHAPAAIAMFDRTMRYMATSRRWLTDYGVQIEVLGRSHYEVFPEIADRWKEIHRRALEGAVESADEDRFERADGRIQWLKWEVRPWTGRDGAIGGIIIFSEDITARKAVEAALRESEARYRATFDNAAVGIAHVGLDGRWLRFNDAVCAITGYSRGELLTKTFADITHPDDIEPDWAAARRLLAGEIETFSLEKRYIRKDGSLIWIDLTVSLQRDAQGHAQNFISVIEDIHGRKEAQAQLLQLADGLERRVVERTKELAVSQDKLRALTTDLHLTEHRVRQKLATDLHDYLAQLLVLSRIKLGQAKLEGVPPSVAQAMTEVQDVMDQALSYTRTLVAQLSPPILNEFGLPVALRWLAEQMQQRMLTVSLKLDTEVPPLSEDQSVLLFQSVRELLMNIVKHADTPEARLEVAQAEGILRITVSDQGAGFNLAAVEASFEPGFGLFSIRERMKALGGGFELQSTLGRGTTAVLLLPLDQTTAVGTYLTDDVESSSELGGISPEPALTGSSRVLQIPHFIQPPKVRVLLVDDHLMLRQGLRTIVNRHLRLEVVGEAGDGLEAIDLARTVKPDVVVMDVNMPRCDGVTATKRIKEEFPHIKIVALSMHNSPDMIDRMKQAGASNYLTKESAGSQLCRAIVDAAAGGE